MTIPIYVIALKEARDRRREMTRRLGTLGLEFNFIDGVVGADLPPHVVNNRQYHVATPLSLGALGCALSHIMAWQAIAESPTPFGLILEDDAVLTDTVPQLLTQIAALDGKFDIVNLHFRGGRPLVNIAPLSPVHTLTSCRYNSIGAESYVLSKAAAKRLLTAVEPITYEVDLFLNRWWNHGVQILTVNPAAVHEDDSVSTIGYSSIPPAWPNDKPVHYLSRKINRLWDSLRKRLAYPSMVAAMKARLEMTDGK